MRARSSSWRAHSTLPCSSPCSAALARQMGIVPFENEFENTAGHRRRFQGGAFAPPREIAIGIELKINPVNRRGLRRIMKTIVDRYAPAAGDKAYDLISGHRIAASGIADHHVVDAFYEQGAATRLAGRQTGN